MNLSIYLFAAFIGNVYLTQYNHLNNKAAAFMCSLVFLGLIIGSPAIGHLADQIHSKKRLMQANALLATICIFIILSFPFLSETLLSLLFFSLGAFSSAQTLVFPVIAENYPIGSVNTAMSVALLLLNGIGAFSQTIFIKIIELLSDKNHIFLSHAVN